MNWSLKDNHLMRSAETKLFQDDFDFIEAIEITREQGYYFKSNVLTEQIRANLEGEIDGLPLEVGDHIVKPLNQNKPNEVRQLHSSFFTEYGDSQVPIANIVIDGLSEITRNLRRFPELQEWRANEVGYQRYRTSSDFIGPHRDRISDHMLSITFTITGAAEVQMFEPVGDYMDYSNLSEIDGFLTSPGSVMLLRATDFGSGERVIHQVMPPLGTRSILNLRTRSTVLDQPSELAA